MGQRLLLVDSDRSFLKEHQVSLEAAFELEVASALDGVLSRLDSGAFAAVLICVEVADNKGYALCSTLRKHPKTEGVKIALISAKATEEEYRRHQSLKGRADLYLHKPIAPSALVAALAPLVPGRTLDPDNPLGELVDTELGDDWLDGLKSVLDGPALVPASAPVFGVRPSSPGQTTHLDARPTAPPDTGRLRILEEQVAALQEELHAKDQRLAAADERLQAAEAEALQVQRQLNSVTLNLDDLERSNRESASLKVRLAETEASLHSLSESKGRDSENAETLKAQLREALTERAELIQQVETLNQQVGEKAQRTIELLKERDRLLRESLDLEPFRARAQELEGALAARQETLAAKEETLAALQQEFEAARLAQDQLHTTIEGLVEQQGRLEGVHQSALLEVAGYKEKAHIFQMEVAGLEATMRGQGRDLVELGGQLRQREAELEARQAQMLERDQVLLAKEEIIHKQVDEASHLTAQLTGLIQELDENKIQHEGERLELMNGLDQKEAELHRLNQLLEGQQQAQGTLEREKQALLGQLAEHRDRLQNLDGLLKEIQDQLRRGSDLARG